MDIDTFRRRVLEIQAELAALDPTEPGAADRARSLGAEVNDLADEQRERTARVAARAFGQTVTRTGVDAPVDTLSTLVDRIEAATASEQQASTDPAREQTGRVQPGLTSATPPEELT